MFERKERNIYHFPKFFKFGGSRKSTYAYVVGMGGNGTLTYAKKKKKVSIYIEALDGWLSIQHTNSTLLFVSGKRNPRVHLVKKQRQI